MVRIVNWNGKDLPEELRHLPPGQYVVEPVDAGVELSEDEEEGIRVALVSLQAGKGRSPEQVRERLDGILRR